jgi:hypothetical protein
MIIEYKNIQDIQKKKQLSSKDFFLNKSLYMIIKLIFDLNYLFSLFLIQFFYRTEFLKI